MQCSVVIPCHNGSELTRACVASLLDQAGAPELEILLVDNGSSDATPTLGSLDPRVVVLRQPGNLGFAGGVNAGLRAARHPFVLVLNNDTQAAPNLLDELHRALTGDPAIGAAAPVSNHVKGQARIPVGPVGRDAAARRELAAALANHPPLQDVDTLAGLCLLLRRSTLAQIGPFDERFGHGNFEDDDYCLRLRLAGYRLVIARRAFLHHEGHATFQALGLRIQDEIERRGAQFRHKWAGDPAGAAVIAAQRDDHATAAHHARLAQRCHPAWSDADWHLARGEIVAGRHAAAIPHLLAVLAANPRHSDAATLCAEALLSTGDDAGAQRVLEGYVAHCALTPEQQRRLHGQLGLRARQRGDRPAAVQHLRTAAALAPDDGALHNWLGVCLFENDDLAAAAAAFAAAARCGDADGRANLHKLHQLAASSV